MHVIHWFCSQVDAPLLLLHIHPECDTTILTQSLEYSHKNSWLQGFKSTRY